MYKVLQKYKKIEWAVELVIITCFFGAVLYVANQIVESNRIVLGFSINVGACLLFLMFSVLKLKQSTAITNNLPFSYFYNRFKFKYIWIVLLAFVCCSISYKLIMKLEFVHFFGLKGHAFSGQLSSFQSWVMITLIVLYIPIIVFSEEIFFRCYLFEIQYLKYRNYTWLINGFSWSVYHIFTSTNFLAILPTCFLVSYVYQKKRNIWITIAIHLFINFIALFPALKFYLNI